VTSSKQLLTKNIKLGKTKPAKQLELEAVQCIGKHCSVFNVFLHAQIAIWALGGLCDNVPCAKALAGTVPGSTAKLARTALCCWS